MAMLLVGCSNYDEGNTLLIQQNTETLRDSLSISPMSSDTSFCVHATRSVGGSINVGIFSVRIATKKTGCLSGFGLCDFKWFPNSQEPSVPNGPFAPNDTAYSSMRPSARYAKSNVQKTPSGTYYTVLLLDRELPIGLAKDNAYLQVDDDIYWVNDSITRAEIMQSSFDSESLKIFENEVLTHKYFKINKGNIKYEPSLGTYGGYFIELEHEAE